jgi:membrane-associated protein
VELAVNWLDPTSLITAFGVLGILLVLFAETGLLVGFFLPGDTLLFSAGIFATAQGATGAHLPQLSLPLLLVLAPLFAIAGAQFGHFLGAKYGRKLFDRPKSRLFKQEHVAKAEHYFQKFGPARAVVLARFIPVVRTFINPLAGMLEMGAVRFFAWNVVGAILWTETIVLVGYFAGSKIGGIDKIVLPVVLLAVTVSLIPVIREIIKSRKVSGKKNGPEESRPSLTGESSR